MKHKSYFAQFLHKILVFAYFVISCNFVISSYFVISLNLEKQFQEMMYKFKIINQSISKSTILQPAHTCWANKPQFSMYSCKIMNSDFNFVFMWNFVQNWSRIDTKMMRNFVQKKSFRAKPRNCGARELTVSWKPTNRNKKPLDKQKIYLQNFAQRKFVMNKNAALKIKFYLNLNIILWQ